MAVIVTHSEGFAVGQKVGRNIYVAKVPVTSTGFSRCWHRARKYMMKQDYLTVRQLAEEVGISYRRTLDYVQLGKILTEKVADIHIISRADAEAFKAWHAAHGGRWPK